jgi:hypothetical protein
MKQILFLVFFGFYTIHTQDGFVIQSGQAVWSHVYEKPFSGLPAICSGTPASFTIDGFTVQVSPGEKTIFILESPMRATGKIEIQESRYRVTVTGIQFKNPLDSDSWVSFTDVITNKNGLRNDAKAMNSIRILNDALTSVFNQKSNEW